MSHTASATFHPFPLSSPLFHRLLQLPSLYSVSRRNGQIKNHRSIEHQLSFEILYLSKKSSSIKMAHMRVTHRDEEGKKVVEKVPIPKTRHPDTARHFERKLEEQGLHRLERHPANGHGGIGAPPPKSGRGGKYTWEGPDGLVKSELESVPPAIDPNDPNYVEEEEGEEEDEVAKEVVIGEVEVAKVAEERDGVARVDVAPPLQP